MFVSALTPTTCSSKDSRVFDEFPSCRDCIAYASIVWGTGAAPDVDPMVSTGLHGDYGVESGCRSGE